MRLALLAQLVLGMPDARFLAIEADRAGVDPRVVLAIAWEETRTNTSPTVRGAAGEVGRFQLAPATARRYCKGLDVRLYHQNVACFFRVFRRLQDEFDLPGLLPVNAIRRYNGSGPKARAYTERVLKTARGL